MIRFLKSACLAMALVAGSWALGTSPATASPLAGGALAGTSETSIADDGLVKPAGFSIRFGFGHPYYYRPYYYSPFAYRPYYYRPYYYRPYRYSRKRIYRRRAARYGRCGKRWSGHWYRCCARKYRTFNARSGRFHAGGGRYPFCR